MRLMISSAAAVLALAASAGAAKASIAYLDLPSLDVHLTMAVSDTPNALGLYDLGPVGGTFGPATVAGNAHNSNAPFVSYWGPLGIPFDNVFDPTTAEHLDDAGFVILVQGGAMAHIFNAALPDGDGIHLQLFSSTELGTLFFAPDATWRTTATIPEPASWALMILGFGATGAALRRIATKTGRPYACA